jgi:AhpC/TSA family
MALQEKLDALREASKARIPPETRAVMERSIADLRASGVMDRVAQVGQPAPDFTLPNTSDVPVRLADLRARGPLVLSFYRGRW